MSTNCFYSMCTFCVYINVSELLLIVLLTEASFRGDWGSMDTPRIYDFNFFLERVLRKRPKTNLVPD